MPWVSQDTVPSSRQDLLRRTYRLRAFLPEIIDILRAYHNQYPKGKDYTLRVFQRLGEARIRNFGDSFNLTFGYVKQMTGLFVPQILVEIYGPKRVETDRNANNRANNLRNTDPVTNHWLITYTRHRVEE